MEFSILFTRQRLTVLMPESSLGQMNDLFDGLFIIEGQYHPRPVKSKPPKATASGGRLLADSSASISVSVSVSVADATSPSITVTIATASVPNLIQQIRVLGCSYDGQAIGGGRR
jgi:hypothetical protein